MRVSVGLMAAMLLSGCRTRVTTGAAPEMPRLAGVVDGDNVRARPEGGRWTDGRALGWNTGYPRLISSAGDTVSLPCDHELQLRGTFGDNHGLRGVIAGVLVGGAIQELACRGKGRYCGEEDPTPALTAMLGYLVGSRIPADGWRTLPRSDCQAQAGDQPPANAAERRERASSPAPRSSAVRAVAIASP